MTASLKPVRVTGTLYWTKWMSEYNTHFNEDNTKYECTLGDISEDKAQQLFEDLGIKRKTKEGQGNFIVGKSNYKFELVDEDGVPIPVDTVGQGTKVVALVTSYTHKMSKQHGNSASIRKLIVTELKTPAQAMAEEEDDYIL